MNRNYIKGIFTITLSLIFNFSFSQDSSSNTSIINIDNPVCEVPVPENVNTFSIKRRESVIERMGGRLSSPCSTFSVSYNGFTNEAQTAFQFAVDIWSNLIDSPVPIRVNANFAPAAETNLGSASPAFYRELTNSSPNPFADVLYPAALYEKLIGQDSNGPSGESIDITCNFNSNRDDWYFGLDANPPNNRIDFVTTVLHELGHGLGVAGFGIKLSNDEVAIRRDQSGSTISSNSNHVSIWDTYIDGFFLNFIDPLNPTTPFIIDESEFPDPSTPSEPELKFQLEDDNLSINAPTAVSENNGEQPKTEGALFRNDDGLTVFRNGSSYSHLDESTFNNTPHALMTPFSGFGEANHDPGNIILGFMQDMGWTLCQGTLNTNDFDLESVKVSPNPFTDVLTIDLPSQLSNQEFNISIIDINGRIVSSFNERRNNTITVSNLADLDKALYFLKIQSNSSDLSITKKIIKQ